VPPRAEDAEIKILIAVPDKRCMRRDPSSASAAAKRLAVMFASLLVAFAIGSATHSVEVFVAVMGVGVVVGLALRAADAFGPSTNLKHVPGPMTSSTEPVGSLVYAPLRVRINCVSTAFFTGFMVVAFLGALLGWAIDSFWAFLVVGLPVVFPTVWAIGRGARVRLVASSERLLIDNTWRSYELRWSEVDGVGIRQAASCFPQPVLWFRLVGRSPVVAQATPVRRSVRQEFQTQLLSFAPALVQRLDDELAGSWLGADSAPSYRLRLWWLKRHPNGRWARFLEQLGA
jgi:hypothetical protein